MSKNMRTIAEAEISQSKISDTSELFPYPVAPSLLLTSSGYAIDEESIAQHRHAASDNAGFIALDALEHWQLYLLTSKLEHREAFLRQAQCLCTHMVRIGDDASGWLCTASDPLLHKESACLSASVQGTGLSVLARAYQLTRNASLLETLSSLALTFARDILDGGIQAPIGDDGIFFEELALYPASHSLQGCMLALFGLLDYVAVTADQRAQHLISRCHSTLHLLLHEFDAGFWTYTDLQARQLASPSLLVLQSTLLGALAQNTACATCALVSSRWQSYRQQRASRLRYVLSSQASISKKALWTRLKLKLFPQARGSSLTRVCIPVTAFPVTGGMRAVLASVAQAMEGRWQIEYVTQHAGPNPTSLTIHQFGTLRTTPWQFPAIWLYALVGWLKLFSLLRRGVAYQVFLPQDGIATAAFTALAARLAGARVVCIDHGNLTLLKSAAYRAERLQALAAKNWSFPRLLFARWRYTLYWPSLALLARLAARSTDHFLIPGVAGDGVEASCQAVGIRASQLTRFASMIDIHRYPLLDHTSRAALRATYQLPADALIVAIACRLSPEKGLEIALEALKQTYATLPAPQRARMKVIIAGAGPQRQQIEQQLQALALSGVVSLWGEIPPQAVIELLSLSDVFFYTSARGACFSMAVLEAMAAGCAVIASTQPFSNQMLLDEGRGIAIAPGNAGQAASALIRLLSDVSVCHHMGKMAREYIATNHSQTAFRRTLQRATHWSELGSLLCAD